MSGGKVSRGLSPSGRETSYGRDTSGYKGWIPVHFCDGSKNSDGSPRTQPGFKNVLNNQEVTTPEPPYPTGEATTRHASSAYAEGWERIWGKKETDHARSEQETANGRRDG